MITLVKLADSVLNVKHNRRYLLTGVTCGANRTVSRIHIVDTGQFKKSHGKMDGCVRGGHLI
jgi:hypothetical protein